jgi:hypothetical protein
VTTGGIILLNLRRTNNYGSPRFNRNTFDAYSVRATHYCPRFQKKKKKSEDFRNDPVGAKTFENREIKNISSREPQVQHISILLQCEYLCNFFLSTISFFVSYEWFNCWLTLLSKSSTLLNAYVQARFDNMLFPKWMSAMYTNIRCTSSKAFVHGGGENVIRYEFDTYSLGIRAVNTLEKLIFAVLYQPSRITAYARVGIIE